MTDQLEMRVRRELSARAERVSDDLVAPPLSALARLHTPRVRWLAVAAASLAVAAVVATVGLLVSRSSSRQSAVGDNSGALAGTSWLVTGVTTPAGREVAIATSEAATFTFADSTHVAGFDSVNHWDAKYKLRGSSLTFQSMTTGLVGTVGGDATTEALVTSTHALLASKAVIVDRDAGDLTLAAAGYTVHLTLKNEATGS